MKTENNAKSIHSLIMEGEHQQQDFKFEISDIQKIARTLSAFANTEGGRLLIGVKDNGRISGVRSEEEAYMIEAAAKLYCLPKVQYSMQAHRVEGKQFDRPTYHLHRTRTTAAKTDGERNSTIAKPVLPESRHPAQISRTFTG